MLDLDELERRILAGAPSQLKADLLVATSRLRSADRNARETLRRWGEPEADTCVDPVFALSVLAIDPKEYHRLRAGKFTAEEIYNMCHNLPLVVGSREFANGCAREQRTIYGCAPDADEVERLRSLVARAHLQLKSSWDRGELPASALSADIVQEMESVAATVPQRSGEEHL